MLKMINSLLSHVLAFLVVISSLAFLFDFNPPTANPIALWLVTIVISGLLVSIVNVLFGRLAEPLKLWVSVITSLLAMTFLLAYLQQFQAKVFDLPPRIVCGYVYQEIAKAIRDEEFQRTGVYPSDRELLDATGGELPPMDRALKVWTEGSIQSSQLVLNSIWIASFACLSIALMSGYLLWNPYLMTPRSLTSQINGKKLGAAFRAIVNAFDENSLRSMLRDRMDVILDEVIGPGSLRDRASQLVDWANREGRIDELIESAVKEVPGNPLLKGLSASWGQAQLPKNE